MSRRTADNELNLIVGDGHTRALTICPDHTALWEAMALATRGGKRFRPALVSAVHDALGGSAHVAVAQVGAAVELLHTAFIVHDDVIDGDDIRRGQLNVSGTFRERARAAGVDSAGASTYALTAGILAGDLAIAAAMRAVGGCQAPRDVVLKLLDLFDEALHVTASGELADVRLSLATTSSLADSLQMAEQKTSAYSFSLPMHAGALLAGAADDLCADLAAAGRQMGMAFQLLDDLIGVFGDPDRTGKSATSDLRTHKQTPLLAHAQTTPQWPRIEGYIGRELSISELQEVRALLTTSGSRAFIEDLASSYLASARGAVHRLGLDEDIFALALPASGLLVPPTAPAPSESNA